MREAIGGTFLFNIMIVFIFFFAAFLAIAINYSQAFRIKNQVINYIEQYEGIDDAEDKIISYINQSGYYRAVTCDCDVGGVGDNYDCGAPAVEDNRNGGAVSNGSSSAKGLCVRKLKNDATDDVYYRVTTFVSFNLPVIGDFFTFPVKGETKAITNP